MFESVYIRSICALLRCDANKIPLTEALSSRQTIPQVDARAKCTGQTKFADDIVLPRMLFAKILRSHHPHALIKSIDTSKAEALPGVLSVITGKELPIPYGILPVSQDEHALCIDKVRFIGDPVAAVAAIDEDTAFDAMNLIEGI